MTKSERLTVEEIDHLEKNLLASGKWTTSLVVDVCAAARLQASGEQKIELAGWRERALRAEAQLSTLTEKLEAAERESKKEAQAHMATAMAYHEADECVASLEQENERLRCAVIPSPGTGEAFKQICKENARLRGALEKYRHCRHGNPNCFCTTEASAILAQDKP